MFDPISAETLAHVQAFLQRHKSWGIFAEPTKRLLASLDAIKERREVEAAALLWPGIEGRSIAVQQKVLEVITDLLACAASARVPDLVRKCQQRNSSWEQEDYERWWNISVDKVRIFAAMGPTRAGLLIFLSGHHNGYVREAAVIGLDGLSQTFVLVALRDRLNDWVDQVRRVAAMAMRGFLKVEHAAILVESLDVLSVLERCGRADHQPLLDQIGMILREPAAREHLKVGLASSNQAIRRGCYATLLRAEISSDEWLTWGLESNDPWIRLHAARAIRELPEERKVGTFIDLMASVGLRPVRQIALEMIAASGIEAVDRLKYFLTDVSPTLRGFARYYLTKILGQFDAKFFYRDGLASAPINRMSRFIAGIAETGDSEDVARIEMLVLHPKSGIRLAAIRALGRLAPGAMVELFLIALTDKVGRIRQSARETLMKLGSELPIERLQSWTATTNAVGRRCGISLLWAHPRAGLSTLHPFLLDVDDDVRSLAESLCLRGLTSVIYRFVKPDDPWRNWINHHRSGWSPAFREQIDELIRRADRRW